MAKCTICDGALPSAKRHNYYCSDACKQKAWRQRQPPERLAALRAASRDRCRAWRDKFPDKAKDVCRRWASRNRERTRENARRFLAQHPGYGRVNSLRRLYGLTPSEYDAMHAAQAGRCASCGEPETWIRAGKLCRLAVDHDHGTGAVRALLCHGCNVGIGNMGDDPVRLEAAATYLRKFQRQ